MIPEQAWAAAFFGALSAASCVIGAGLGVAWRPPQRAVAAIMAFGAGALLSALAFELILVAYESSGFVPVLIGSVIGGVSFVVLNELLNGQGGFLRKPATTARYLREQKKEEVEDLLHKLSRVAILRVLPPEEIQAIIPHVEAVKFGPGERVFEQGDKGDALYLIAEGEVDLYVRHGRPGVPEPIPGGSVELVATTPGDGNVKKIARLGPSEAFGEMALLTGEPRSATVVAASNAALWRIKKEDFDELVAASPHLAQAVGQLLARNLAAVTAQESVEEAEASRWQSIARRYVETRALTVTPTEVREAAREHSSTAAMGIFLGLMLDGIPESLVIGMSMIGAPTVSAALIVGLFLSNLPEALSSAVGMKLQGVPVARIMGMWTFLMIFIGVGAFLGNALFLGAPKSVIAAFEAAAAGAMLTMIAETALPEAYEQGGWLSGIATLMGFLAAFFVGTLGAAAH